MSSPPSETRRAVSYRRLTTLIPNPRNARVHPKKQIAKLKAAILRFGFTNPILITAEGMILCGYGRYLAALELGLGEVPTIVIDGLGEEDVRALVLADNLIAGKAGYDQKLLRAEVKYLAEIGYEVELTGLDTIEIDTMLSIDDDESLDSDDLVELPNDAPPVTRIGDLWHIGPHRLVVGDARDAIALERLLAGERAQMAFLDPPYGCPIKGFASTHHEDFIMGAGQESLPELAMAILRPAFKNLTAHCTPGCIAFVCSDWRAAIYMHDAAKGVFDEIKNWICWAKTNASLGSFYRSQFELIFVFRVTPGKPINNFGLGEGGRHRSNLWTYAGANTFRRGRLEDLKSHPTIKPKRLVADAIRDCSRRNGAIVDTFAGAGTTLVAAAMTGRRGFGIEIDPRYADVILDRVSKECGATPLLDGREPLATIAAARRVATDEG
jgi:DNA modification methylase